MSSNYLNHELVKSDEPFLYEMLYQALYVPEGGIPYERNIIENPELAKYVKDWGKEHDFGLISVKEENDQKIGAIWIRLLIGQEKGYGYINNTTPELTFALLPEYRNQGLGTQLLQQFLDQLAQKGYVSISLSVDPESHACRLYRRFGFEDTGIISGTSVTVLKTFK